MGSICLYFIAVTHIRGLDAEAVRVVSTHAWNDEHRPLFSIDVNEHRPTSMASVRWQAATAHTSAGCGERYVTCCAQPAQFGRPTGGFKFRMCVVIEVKKFTDELDETIPKYCCFWVSASTVFDYCLHNWFIVHEQHSADFCELEKSLQSLNNSVRYYVESQSRLPAMRCKQAAWNCMLTWTWRR